MRACAGVSVEALFTRTKAETARASEGMGKQITAQPHDGAVIGHRRSKANNSKKTNNLVWKRAEGLGGRFCGEDARVADEPASRRATWAAAGELQTRPQETPSPLGRPPPKHKGEDEDDRTDTAGSGEDGAAQEAGVHVSRHRRRRGRQTGGSPENTGRLPGAS